MQKKQIINDVSAYYTTKLQTFGATPQGVDWNSSLSQEMRFGQLSQIINLETAITPFSVLDYGCGFGAMYPFLKTMFGDKMLFWGYDISEAMLNKAVELYGEEKAAKWINTVQEIEKVDYVIASGIFNVRLTHGNSQWEPYIIETLQDMNRLSKKGFAFNMLTSYSDKEYMRDNLYYADSLYFFDYCKRNFSQKVALLHDYPLYEFTILVKK